MELFDFWVNFVANLFTIAASGIALYVFFFNRKKIKATFNLLLNYSYQVTLNDLKNKIERLNDYNANDAEQKNQVINILHEIEGQINGSEQLQEKLPNQLEKIKDFTSTPKLLNEPKKRSLVSELRESVKNIDISNYQNILK